MYKPDILTGIGIAGVFITAYLSAKAAIKYKEETEGKDLETKEKAVTAVKCFAGAAAVATGTALVIYRSNDLSKAYLTEAYGMYKSAQRRLDNQTAAIKETVPEEVQEDIQKKTDEKTVSEAIYTVPSNIFIEDTGTGDDIFYDTFSDRYFKMSKEQFLFGRYEFNRTYQLKGSVNFNYLYRLWGVKESQFGEIIGWNEYYMSGEWDTVWIDIDCRKIKTAKGDTMYLIDYYIPPKWEYEDY